MENTNEAIAKLTAELEALKVKAAEELKEKLTSLPEKMGYKSMVALVTDLLPYCRGKFVAVDEASAVKPGAPKAAKKGKRVTITDEMRKGIVEDLKAGKTAKAVATKHGVSVASVNLIKKAAKLTKKKK